MILSHEKCVPSCKLLRDEIKKLTGVHLGIATTPEKIKRDKKLHIRYGNSEPVAGKSTLFNSAESIALSSSKIRFSKALNNNGLQSPILKSLYNNTPKKTDFPIIVRNRIQGKSGEGILGVFESFDDLTNDCFSGYWAKFYRLSWELRLHIFKGNIIRMFSKQPFPGVKEKYPIRNNERYHFRLVNHNDAINSGKYKTLLPKIEKIHSDILKANFFVLDCGWCPDLEDYLFLESGTAPGLNENSAREYAERLVREIF